MNVRPFRGFVGRSVVVERVLGEDIWRVARPLRYYSPALRKSIYVPVGFQTDFASIPRFLWRIMPKNSTYDGAAVLHDYGYRGNLSRCESDEVFHEAMLFLGVPRWKARLMFYAVRLFGRSSYKGKS